VKVALVVKAAVLHKRRFRKELALLERSPLALQVEVLPSEYPGHAVERARLACVSVDCVLAVGGDGTLSQVLNGCMQAQRDSPGLVLPPLGVLAYGTANDFIKSTTLTGRVEQLLDLLAVGSARPIDIGHIRCRSADDKPLESWFINAANVGIGADVSLRVNRGRRRLGAGLTFLRAIILSLLAAGPRTLKLSSDGGLDWRGEVLDLVVGNGRYFGNGLSVLPDSVPDDGRLNLALVGRVGLRELLAHWRDLKQGVAFEHPRLSRHSFRRLEVAAPDGPAPVEADGEFLGYTPATFEVLPAAIRVLMQPDQSDSSSQR